MSLLSLDGVTKRYAEGLGERVVLDAVSMELGEGELGVVWGLRRSGRSTLLRIAAGVQTPDAGTVRFEGRDLAERSERLLGTEIGYCRKSLRSAEGGTVLEELLVGLLARGDSSSRARARASHALRRVGAPDLASRRLTELDATETIRVALARTLAHDPRLLIVDEPVQGVDLLDRDEILRLVRAIADEGVAVLASATESTGLSGADRAYALGGGELRGGPTAEPAPVIELRPASGQRAAG